MDTQTDLLDSVVAELNRRKGELPRIARETGVPYDTVLRIKNRESDPGYSKVRRLATFLFKAATPTAPAPEHQQAA